MRLSNLTDYAIVLMSAAARHCGGAGLDPATGKQRTRTNAATLADETGVPVATAHKLVHALVRARLLKSVRGSGGGIKLARPAAAISVADIVEAIEGPIALTTCVDSARHDCAIEEGCRVRPHWAIINASMRGALGDVSLASLTHSVHPEPVEGLSLSRDRSWREEQDFDKFSPNGVL